MVNPSAKRQAAQQSLESGMRSNAAACRALGLAHSGFYRMTRASMNSQRIRKKALDLSARHSRDGYHRITVLLPCEVFDLNPKRLARIRGEEGIKVSKKRRSMRLGGSTVPRARPSVLGRCGAGTLSKTRQGTAGGSEF